MDLPCERWSYGKSGCGVPRALPEKEGYAAAGITHCPTGPETSLWAM